MQRTMRNAASILCVAAASAALSATVDEDAVRAAAEAFVSRDAVGSAVLRGTTVKSARERDGLWVVSLAPAGHVILSGSDLADPIVGFSKNDFAEPVPDSPAYTMLQCSSDACRAKESAGGERNAKWKRLLEKDVPRIASPSIENPATIVVEPFLKSHYNQWQPYNDYTPVYDSSLDSGVYRGRCPCGCVATATAQGFRYFRWPARIDRVETFNHSFTDTNQTVKTFPLRFEGHVPIDWNSLAYEYVDSTRVCVTNFYPGGYSWWWESNYDLRGGVAEAVRYPIARLIMFADVLARMSFKSSGSGASYNTVAGNAIEWYTQGRNIDATTATDFSQVLSDLRAGVPLQVSIPGHAVVAHGWASDGDSTYLYLNYGWGGSDDGYYNLDPSQNGSPIEDIRVGHYPRARPQIDPLPKVSGTSLSLGWHFPDFYTNKLSGFTVVVSRTATETSQFLDDFSSSSGTSTGDSIYVGEDSSGYDGKLLFTTARYAGSYTFSRSLTLTSASVLTFKLLSYYTLGAVYEVQARFDGGEWETICTPGIVSTGNSGWSTERVYLGDRGGKTAQFRIRNSRSGGSFYSSGKILVDDFRVTEVLMPEDPSSHSFDGKTRSVRVSSLAPGATYSFTVVPQISGALVEGEPSETITASIAGERRTPIPGAQTYVSENLSFSASDTSGTWSYAGTAVDDTTVLDKSRCSISVAISGKLTASSSLSFGWSANNYYGEGSDTLTAVFTAVDGTATTVWSTTNGANIDRQNVSIPLGGFAGQSGKLAITCAHSGSWYVGDQYGGRLYAPRVTNVQVPRVPAVAWNSETLVALGMPEIQSVTATDEGFYAECGLNVTRFTVQCSESVTSLAALPSHLALVGDGDVSVTEKGGGRFVVAVRPSGVTAENARSRMILTLAATDANGTTAYKDLSLRFAPIEAGPSVTVNAASASGAGLTVVIPYAWFVENGLASEGAADEVFRRVALEDSDGDGQPNWFEYACDTDPKSAADKLKCSIEVVNGEGKVTYEPRFLREGFKAVIRGADDLRAAEWTEVTTETSPLHFFKVVIENE